MDTYRIPETVDATRSIISLPRSKPGIFALLVAIAVAVTIAVGGVASAMHGDISNVEVADRTGFAQDWVTGGSGSTTENAIVQYIGDENVTFGAADTGTFDSFVRVQEKGVESGYNTDGTLEFNTKSGTWTHSLLLSDSPTITIGEVTVTNDDAALADKRLQLDTAIDADRTSETDELPEAVSCGEHENVVTLGPSDSDAIEADAVIEVVCLDPTVSKTVETSLTRTYNWELVKRAFNGDGEPIPDGEGLTLAEGQPYALSWEIVASLASPANTDSDWEVSGDITITNPSPDPLDVTVVDDLVFGAASVAVTIDCGDGDGDVAATVPASADGVAGEAVCSYLAAPGSGDPGTNTASITYTAGGEDHAVDSAEVVVDFSSAATDITPVDETVDVYDLATEPPRLLGSVSVGDTPATFRWLTELSPDNLVCGFNEIVNRANILNSNGVELALSTDSVPVTVTCAASCTLTAGYWMTHNPEFWAAHNGHGPPEDDAWYLIGRSGLGAGELFPYGDTGLTYYEIMRTPPGGDPWFQLAFQYTAAKLNVGNGADPTALGTRLDQAELILRTNDPGKRGKKAKELRSEVGPIRSVLAAYNEGRIRPGHCDEDSWSVP